MTTPRCLRNQPISQAGSLIDPRSDSPDGGSPDEEAGARNAADVTKREGMTCWDGAR